MRFLFWTFLDILKMSIFGFLKIIFFNRTEKSGDKLMFWWRSIFSAEIIIIFIIIFEKFWKSGFWRSIFWTFFRKTSHKAYETSHKNYAATNLIVVYTILLAKSVIYIFVFFTSLHNRKNLIRLMRFFCKNVQKTSFSYEFFSFVSYNVIGSFYKRSVFSLGTP